MSQLENVYYINLDTRPDRKKDVEKQLNNLKWSFKRFEACKPPDPENPHGGRIGCTLSHLNILKLAKHNNLPYVVIVEDDIFFMNPTQFNSSLKTFLNSKIEYDVVLIAGNVIPPYKKVRDFAIKVYFCQTTTGYIVKNHYYDKLINNIETGLQFLIKYPEQHVNFAIDKWWTKLQKVDNWYFIMPPSVVQAPSFSDIENKVVNYSMALLDIDKKWLRRDVNYYPPDIFSSDNKEGVFYDARGSLHIPDIYSQNQNKQKMLKSLINDKEKRKKFIQKDEERKDGIIKDMQYCLDNYTTVTENTAEINNNLLDLTETTFIIPFYYDFQERLTHVETIIDYISRYFNSRFIVAEWGPVSCKDKFSFRFSNSITWVYTKSDLPFSRTIVTNNVFKYVKTKVVVINDADCFVLHESYIKAQKMILEDGFKILHPFSCPLGCVNLLPAAVTEFKNNYYDISKVNLKNVKQDCAAGVGGIVFIDFETYKFLGFENKYFISYSPEAVERIKRFGRFKLKSADTTTHIIHNSNKKYFQTPLFHMEHPRTRESTIMHKYFKSNELLLHCIDTMTDEEYSEYLYRHSGSALSEEEYKKRLGLPDFCDRL